MRAIGAMTIVCAIVVACGEDRPLCYPGDFIGCNCDNGDYGYSACREFANGWGYGACTCDGTTPGVDAGPPRDASSEEAGEASIDSGKLGLFAACTDGAQCESGICFEYGNGQMLCSKSCSAATSTADCPAPSTGCNGKGVCKPP